MIGALQQRSSPKLPRTTGVSMNADTSLVPAKPYHSVSLNAIDEDGYGSDPLLLQRPDQLPYVHLLCNDMLTVQ